MNEQGAEFVNPDKRAFATEALFVDLGIDWKAACK
jgi:hypothetical protein